MRTLNSRLKLNGLIKGDSNAKFYSYMTRQFKSEKFETDKFIPLMLFGSMWYDEKYNIYRFCGETEIY